MRLLMPTASSRLAIVAAVSTAALAGCNFMTDAADQRNNGADRPARTASAWQDDPMAAHDPTEGDTSAAAADDRPRPLMQAQVVLDRLGFAPGVVDGKMGLSTRNALRGFQEANNLDVTGELDDATRAALARWSNIPATRLVTIPADFAAGPFAAIPDEPEDQAKLRRLSYESLDEKLAERFHTTVAVLRELNTAATGNGADDATATGAERTNASRTTATRANASRNDTMTSSASGPTPAVFRAGQRIRVPNIGGDRIDANAVDDAGWRDTLKQLGVGTDQPQAARIVVDKSDGVLRAYDADDKLVALFTATMGSSNDPLPLGNWRILGIAHNPPFNYNPDLFWDADADDTKQRLPPGPNGPVGVVWIDLSKEHYGIHGTPNPETIGRAESHGCVRLTNWDAARLAQMVSTRTKVVFQA